MNKFDFSKIWKGWLNGYFIVTSSTDISQLTINFLVPTIKLIKTKKYHQKLSK